MNLSRLVIALISAALIFLGLHLLAGYVVYSQEKSYFEGQKDAINGDIRIKLNKDSVYIWKKSCWDNGDAPSYQPTYLESIN